METFFWIVFILGVVFLILWLTGVFRKKVSEELPPKKEEEQI